MSTIRREGLDFSTEFTMMPNRWLRDGRLTLKAAALLMLLLSHRAGWRTSIKQLVRDRLEGREAIMSGVAELEKYGYLKREQVRDEKGQMGESVWTILSPDASYPQAPTSENPTTGSESENPRSEPESGFPTSGDAESDNPPPKKTSPKKTNPEENQGYGPAAASEKQRDYLRDLHLHGGGRSPAEVEVWIMGLSGVEADAEIKEALRAIGRGRRYAGDPDNPHLSTKGRTVARGRMIPGHDSHPQPRTPADAGEALF